MKIYLDLLEGNRNSLQAVLREHFGHSTINRLYQPFNKIQIKPNTPTINNNNNTTTSPPQLNPPQTPTANALQQYLSQQQQQLPPQLLQTLQQSQSSNNLLQQHTQLLQLAQQQQYINQLNAAAAAAALNNPNPLFNLQSLHLGAQMSQLTPPPGSQLNFQTNSQQANFQNALNNLNSNAVNQLLLQQQQQQAAQIGANNQTNSFLSALQSKIS
jgi:hypothetical protein